MSKPRRTTAPLHETSRIATQLFLIGGLVAIAWAAVFAAASDSLTVGAGVLLVLYPVIDVIASAIDARTQHGAARQLLLAGAAASAVAAVALGVAATGSVADVLARAGRRHGWMTRDFPWCDGRRIARPFCPQGNGTHGGHQ